MLVRNLALGLSLAMASMVQAGAVVELVRAPDQATYASGDVVRVEVFLRQDAAGPDHALRQVQFDLNATDSALGVSPVTTHIRGVSLGDDVKFWYFGSTPRCAANALICGEKHFIVQDLASTINPGPGFLSITYGIDSFDNSVRLIKDTQMQIVLPDPSAPGSAVKVGEMDVTMPAADGSYTLDLLNAALPANEPNLVDKGAQIRFGFSLAGTETITRWSAAGGEVTGGTFTFVVASGGGASDLVSTAPVCGTHLTRIGSHVLRLTFGGAVTAPTAGQVEIRELAALGAFVGPDLSPQFAITNDGPNTIRLEETGTVLQNEKWYGIFNTGAWADATPFQVNYVVVRGDVNGAGGTTFADLAFINANQGAVADDDLNDINASGTVTFADIAAANAFQGSQAPAVPSGHSCTIP